MKPSISETLRSCARALDAARSRLSLAGDPRVGDLVRVNASIPFFGESERIVVEVEGDKIVVAYGRETVSCNAKDVEIVARAGYSIEEHGEQ